MITQVSNTSKKIQVVNIVQLIEKHEKRKIMFSRFSKGVKF